MPKLDLNKDWLITYEELSAGPGASHSVLKRTESWMKHDLPCDIHMPLIENNIIKEPLEADNCFACEWTEQKSWWFKKSFNADNELLGGETIELTLESLDAESDIFLNGVHLGHHKSAFYPFISDIKAHLNEGENTLLIRLTSGIEHYSEADTAGVNYIYYDHTNPVKGKRGDKRRVMVRKPQYVYGWDWGTRVATCGIMKGAYINSYKKLAVSSVYAYTKSVSGNACIGIETELLNLNGISSLEAVLKTEIYFKNEKVYEAEKEILLQSGINYTADEINIENPRLWWPNGMGEQNLYTVRVTAYTQTVSAAYPDFKLGIRTINVNTDKLNGDERSFTFTVNGVKIFCKGANWIPADSIYARITDEKYDILISEAKEANFNMLRIWGGGIYERDIFYEKCDEYGILLWHDFMFACGEYPDKLEWFKDLCEKEIDYQSKRLRSHASIALFCGNNEIQWSVYDSVPDKSKLSFNGSVIFDRITPAVLHHNCPQILYWRSSPYGGSYPNGENCGDKHHWYDCTMNPDMQKRITPEEYDKAGAKFISEYGYIGPCKKSSVIKYLGTSKPDRSSGIWALHNNSFEQNTVAAGVRKHYTEPDTLDLDGYLLYAGLCQGLMYQYSLEAIRRKEQCGGSLFWMYDDCWGEVGWTIIDYYLKRKISYYYVKRAFAPVKLIMREENGVVSVTGINETSRELSFDAQYGYTDFSGKIAEIKTTSLVLKPRSRAKVFEFVKPENDYKKGLCFMKVLGQSDISPALLRTNDFRELELSNPKLKISDITNINGTVKFNIASSGYAHAVHFKLDDSYKLSDEYFDLLPDESKTIEIYGAGKDFDVKSVTAYSVY